MSITDDNLDYAFTGESLANRRYSLFAEKAEEEGQERIALLFRVMAEAEAVHARSHLKAMGGIRSTRENLLATIENEDHESTDIYPAFIKQARNDGNEKAAESFDLARKVEQTHRDLCMSALSNIETSKNAEPEVFYVCQNCGNAIAGEIPERCSVCSTPGRLLKLMK